MPEASKKLQTIGGRADVRLSSSLEPPCSQFKRAEPVVHPRHTLPVGLPNRTMERIVEQGLFHTEHWKFLVILNFLIFSTPSISFDVLPFLSLFSRMEQVVSTLGPPDVSALRYP